MATKATKSASTVYAVKTPKRKRNEQNDPYWEISEKRRVTVQKFKGRTLVALREYYEKDGQQLPGKQGISLTVEQFCNLLRAVKDIKKTLKDDYNEHVFDEEESDDEDDEDDEDVLAEKSKTKTKKLNTGAPKQKKRKLDVEDDGE